MNSRQDMRSSQDVRLGADIGGTFTDIALDVHGSLYSTKVLTNYAAPEQAILGWPEPRAGGPRC